METASETTLATFTYRGGYDNPKAYVLNYHHLQKTFMRLRKAGHRFRYLAVGEFGGQRQRAHWHVIFFWENDPPAFDDAVRRDYWFWDWGEAQLEVPRSGQASAAYLMDYLDKDALQKSQLKFSKVPPIGHTYLIDYARSHARQRLALFARGNIYTIPGNTRANGELYYYPVERDRAIYTEMIYAFIDEWARCQFDQPLALSKEIKEFLDDTENDFILSKWTERYPRVVPFLIHHGKRDGADLPSYLCDVLVAMDDPFEVIVRFDTHAELQIWKDRKIVWRNHDLLGDLKVPDNPENSRLFLEKDKSVHRETRGGRLGKMSDQEVLSRARKILIDTAPPDLLSTSMRIERHKAQAAERRPQITQRFSP